MLKANSVLLLLTLLVASVSAVDPKCCVCPGCRDQAGRFDLNLGGWITCADVDLEMARDLQPGTSECTSKQNEYYDRCCNANFNFNGVVEKVPDPNSIAAKQQTYPLGDNDPCEVCYKDNSFPSKPYTVTAILYMPGNPTCEDLFYMGRQGSIPDRLCYPLQDYMQGPCGCDGSGSGGGGSPPSGGGGGSGGVPNRKKRPASANKNNFKLGGGRARGTTRRKLLKGQ